MENKWTKFVLTFISISIGIFTLRAYLIALPHLHAQWWTIILSLANLLVLITFCFLLLYALKKKEIEDTSPKADYKVEAVIKNIICFSLSLIVVFFLFVVDYNEKHPLHQRFIIFENIFNCLSAVFLLQSFTVLREKEVNPFYNFMPVLFFTAYVLVYFTLGGENDTTANWLALTAGLSNGLANALLFAQYAEIVKKYAVSIPWFRTFSPGIFFLLAVYGVVQPLYGAFHTEAFGNHVILENGVFGVCFIGKLFFLYVTYMLLRKGIFHAYFMSEIVSID